MYDEPKNTSTVMVVIKIQVVRILANPSIFVSKGRDRSMFSAFVILVMLRSINGSILQELYYRPIINESPPEILPQVTPKLFVVLAFQE